MAVFLQDSAVRLRVHGLHNGLWAVFSSFCVISSPFYSFMTATSFLLCEEESELFPLGGIFLRIKKWLWVFLFPAATLPSLDQVLVCFTQSPFSDVPNRAVVSCTECYRTCSYMPVPVYKVGLKLLHLADRPGWVVAVCHWYVTEVGCPDVCYFHQ